MTSNEITEFEKACAARAMVVPRWLPGNNVFWYRRSLPSDTWQFIFVDCARGTAQPAFDHAALATTLSSVDGGASESLDADQLPLTWLNVDPDGAWVRFRYADKTWQFSRTNALEVWYGEFEEDQFEQDYDITKPSPRTSCGQSSVTIVNLTGVMLGYYWIDHDGNNERRIDQVLPGNSFLFTSPIGYRFRFWEGSSGRNVVLELKQERGIVNIEDRREGLGVSWDNGGACEPESQATKTASKPDYETFVRRYNLWMRKDKVEMQVSFNGFEDNRYQNASVAPAGRYAVAMQTREGSRYPLELKNSVPDGQLRPKVLSHHTYKNGWRRAGDHLDTDRPHLFDMHARREILIDDSMFSNPYQIQRIGWSDCGNKFRFIFNERGHKHVRLLEISTDGTVKVLVEDSSDTVVDYNQKLWYKMLPATNEVLWASERDGWNHIYRFDLSDGSLKNQVTKGEWVVKSVENVITKEQRIWFTACGAILGQDPYYEHLACVNFDGSDFRLVTSEDGMHNWKFSPDRRYIIDIWSRVDLLPHTAVVEVATSQQVAFLQKEVVDLELAVKYIPPERFTTKGRDGETDIYGVIVRPHNMDETKKYPIIEVIYAHPFQYFTPKRFASLGGSRRRAGHSYVVVLIDGMGTNGRSKAFRDIAYKNLNDAGFPDRIKWMQAAARTRPWMDISRVGITGGSAGGQNAAAAVLHHNDFYKAAIALSGSHDNRMSDCKWAEMFMSWPIDESYERNSNCVHAGKLGGALMLVTGEVDNVVDPSTTMRMASALIDADKDFDLVEEDVVSVVEMLNQDFGRFGLSFTHVNTSYTQNETLATVTDREAMHSTLTRGMRRGQYADLNLFWVAYLANAAGTCTTPNRDYLNGELSWETVVPTDACVMRAMTTKSVRGKIITHEVGHWLGLLHPWMKGCDIGDYIDDTWPQEIPTNMIPMDKRREDNGGEVFQCGAWRPSNYHNFMDYFRYRDSFTDLQGQRMRAYGYLRHKYSTERPLSTGESELWAGCQVKWNGPKSFAQGFACELNTTDTLSLSCATKSVPARAANFSTEQFVVEARCPLEWVGPLEFHNEVICEELNFNHIRCKPDAVP